MTRIQKRSVKEVKRMDCVPPNGGQQSHANLFAARGRTARTIVSAEDWVVKKEDGRSILAVFSATGVGD